MSRRLTATDPTPRLRHPSMPTAAVSVPAGAWARAMALADGDRRRLDVRQGEAPVLVEVLVRNRPR